MTATAAWDFDPLEALRRWPTSRRVMLLHSGRYDARWARRSILAEPAGVYQFLAHGESRWSSDSLPCPLKAFRHKPFADLRALLQNTEGIWIGYLSYDLGRWIEKLPTDAAADRAWPIIELAWCPGHLEYDLAGKRWTAHGSYVDRLPTLNAPNPITPYRAGTPRSVFTPESYQTAVRRILDYIVAGDVFQVNLTQRFTSDFEGDYPLAQRSLFDRLARISPAWYGAYLELAEHRVIASTSPELFLQVDADRRVVTRPIKGTRPASTSPQELHDSEKDTAELNMIVDLMRNDLGRVCAYGSVRVTQPRVIESHPTIHHGVATINGRLHERKDIVDLLRATIPGGSITGAPKVRAMQIIDELEPVRRGPYCGAIGWLSRTGAGLNVAIRTMLVENGGSAKPRAESGRVYFGVGGGIVADSDPAAEFAETLDKARAMLDALNPT